MSVIIAQKMFFSFDVSKPFSFSVQLLWRCFVFFYRKSCSICQSQSRFPVIARIRSAFSNYKLINVTTSAV